MKMSGNTILITGGGSGIGRGLAEAFHSLGNRVLITGRRAAMLEAVAAANPGIEPILLDIDNPGQIATVAAQIMDRFPSLNAVIHNAGIMRNERLLDGNVADAEAIISTNLLGPIRLTAALLNHLVAQPVATLMTVSSGLAFVPLALTPTYCATKAAIHSWTQSLRYQLRNTAVQVIELPPPYVQTELMGERQASDPMAMPLPQFIDEVIALLQSHPDATEICVERVKMLRNAEARGNYESFFQQFNDQFFRARAEEAKNI